MKFFQPLKNNMFILLFIMIPVSNYAQINPTLAVGLEQLTMNKGDIDVKVVADLIMKKRKELNKEALKRFMYNKFPDGNYATKYYIQNCLYTLLNEKNPQVIKKEILELTTNYSIALGLAVIYDINSKKYDLADPEIRKLLSQINADITEMYNLNKLFNLTDTINKNLDYKLIVDIVSLSLSNSEKIKGKGFYKNPINYKEGSQYQNLIAKKEGLKIALDSLNSKITRQIDNYVQNYDVIKEFYSRYKAKKPLEIKDALLEDYNKEILTLSPDSCFQEILQKISTEDNFKTFVLKYSMDTKFYNDQKLKNELVTSLKDNLNSMKTTTTSLTNNDRILSESIAELNKINFYPKDSLIDSNKAQKFITKTQLSEDDINKLTNLIVQYNDAKTQTNADKKKVLEIKTKIFTTSRLILDDKLLLEKIEKNKPNDIASAIIIVNDIEVLAPNIKIFTQTELDNTKKKIEQDLNNIFQKEDFLQIYLKLLVNNILEKKDIDLGLDNKNEDQLKIILEYSEAISGFYVELNLISNKNSINIADINYIEKTIIPKLIKYSLLTDKSDVKKTITNLRILSNLLKVKIVRDANAKGELIYNEKLNDILTFVSNLDKLDKAETYQSIINLVRENNENVTACLPQNFQPIYTLFINGIKKYTLLNTTEQYVEVDVLSFLNDLQQYYNKEDRSWFSLYLTLGLSENFFMKSITLPGSEDTVSNIGFASEKIGLQFTLHSFRKEEGFKNLIKDKVYTNNKNPFVNKIYLIAYGSGLLYSLANTATDENFDYPHVGFGTGLRFYNALDFNVSYCLPFVENQNFGKNGFFSIGLDIPLGEYLENLGKN